MSALALERRASAVRAQTSLGTLRPHRDVDELCPRRRDASMAITPRAGELIDVVSRLASK